MIVPIEINPGRIYFYDFTHGRRSMEDTGRTYSHDRSQHVLNMTDFYSTEKNRTPLQLCTTIYQGWDESGSMTLVRSPQFSNFGAVSKGGIAPRVKKEDYVA